MPEEDASVVSALATWGGEAVAGEEEAEDVPAMKGSQAVAVHFPAPSANGQCAHLFRDHAQEGGVPYEGKKEGKQDTHSIPR